MRILPEKQSLAQVEDDLHIFMNHDPAMNRMWHEAYLAAVSPRPTLVIGDVGTGKELVARAIATMRLMFLRRDMKDVGVLNITAVNESLLESEFFGHVKGAFTGAYVDRVGEFEQHTNGAVVLDEIGDLSKTLQSKILRVIEEPNTFRKVGTNDDLIFNGKVVAATHRDLGAMIESNDFRRDLASRLTSGGIVRVPDLADRSREHIMGLITHFSLRMANQLATEMSIPTPAMDVLLQKQYRNNVRELRDTVEAACISACTAGRKLIELSDIKSIELGSIAVTKPKEVVETTSKVSSAPTLSDLRQNGEKEIVIAALVRNNYSRTKTAKSLGISRVTLYNKMKKYGLLDGDTTVDEVDETSFSTSTNGDGSGPRKPR